MPPTNPASPFVVDTRQLGRRPGSMIEVHRSFEAPSVIGTDVLAVAAGSPLTLDIRLESVVEGVLATGSVLGVATGACVRCLEPVEVDLDGTFQELFAYADRAAHHHQVGATEDESDEYRIDGDLIDLEPVVRDTVVPALPFQPVCRDDCPGLCPQCGATLADDPDHHHDVIDPRWSALQGLAARAEPTNTDERT